MSTSARTIKVGLVGAGYVSTYHLRALLSLDYVRVVGIADIDRKRAESVAREFGLPAAFSSLQEMATVQPDVIHVLTPPATHCRLAVQALGMGCHVLVEKPMAEKADECDRMIAAAKEAGRVLSVSHSARMDPIVVKAAERVARGECGKVLAVDFFRSSDYAPYSGGPELPVPLRTGSYPFQDLGVHGLTLLETFLGPVRQADIRFYGTELNAGLSFDEWHALVQCEQGTGHLYLSWNVRPMQNELVIHGTRGVMHVDCVLQTCTLRKVWPAPKFIQRIISALGNSISMLWQVPKNVGRFMTGRLRPSPGIHASVIAFYESLRQGLPVPVAPEEGRRIVACMESASRRADEDKVRSDTQKLKPTLPSSRVLVTGASGFLGGALVRRLIEHGESVRVLLRRTSKQTESHSQIQIVYGDLGDPAIVEHAVEGVDVVYHVGATMNGAAADFERGTVWGTRNIIAAVLKHKIKRLVYVSSLSVLDHASHRPGEVIDQGWPLEPHADKRGLYTQSKLVAEQLVVKAAREQHLPAVVLRPGQIFGPGAEHATPSGVISLAGRWLVVGNGDSTLPLVYVDDVVDALLWASEPENVAVGSILHIVDGEQITQREYLTLYQRSGLEKHPVHYLPRHLFYLGACCCEVASKLLHRELPLSRYRLRSIRPLSGFAASSSSDAPRWRPTVGIRAGLQRTFAWHDGLRAQTLDVSGTGTH